jgi:hypothetical protein
MQNSTLFVLSTVAALLFATMGASACGGGPIGAAPNKVEQNKAAPTESAKELSDKLAREAETRCLPGAAEARLAAELAAAAKTAATDVARPVHEDPASPPDERDPSSP